MPVLVSRKSTLPVGVPVPWVGATLAVKVIVCPGIALATELVSAVAVATAPLLTTVTAALVNAPPPRVPSLGVTAAVMASPGATLPDWARFKVLPVAPLMAALFLYHW